MISAQLFKVLNDVWGNKTRSLLIILSIFAGLFALGTVLNARALLTEGTAQSFAAVHYANGTLLAAQPFDKAALRSLDAVPGVAEVDARRSLRLRAIHPTKGYIPVQVFSLDYADMRVNMLSSGGGQWPPPHHQALVENASLAVLGASLGDTLTLETESGLLRALPLTGKVKDLAQLPAAFVGSAYLYVDEDTLVWLGGEAGYNQLFFTVSDSTPTKAETRQVLNRVVDKVEEAGNQVITSQVVAELPIGSVMDTLLFMLTGISGLSLFLSVFLIINTISAMIAQQIRQIGVMKAVGGRAGQILWMYLAVVLFYGLIALLTAAPLSIIGGTQLSLFLADMFGFTIPNRPIQPLNILVQVVVGVLVPGLASLFPLVNGLRLSATKALSSEGISQSGYGDNLIDRLLSGANLWFTRRAALRPVILSLRNMLRHKSRLALTLLTLSVAGAVFITIFNMRATVFQSIEEMTRMQTYDMLVDFSRPYRLEKIQQEIARIPEIESIDSWLVIPSRRMRPDGSQSDDIPLTALRADSTVIAPPKLLAGRWLSPTDDLALVFSSSLKQFEPDLQVGQSIRLKIEGRVYTYLVVGEAMGGEGGNAVFVNYPYTAALVNNNNRFSAVQIKLKPGAVQSPEDWKKVLEAQLQAGGLRVASIQTTQEMRANRQATFGSVLVLLTFMALLLALVGGLGLMGTMSINVLERTREIGVLRAIGSSHRGVNRVFMMEGVAIGMSSCMFAIPLSFPITNLMAASVGMLAASTPWEGAFTPSGIFVWIATVLVLSLLANYLPARSAARLTVREVLAYE